MLWRVWLAVAAVALLFTLCWLFVEKRLFLTTLLSTILWAWLGTTAGDLEVRSLEAGTTAPIEIPSLQWVMFGMTALSVLAAFLHYFGHYPPQDDTVEPHLTDTPR
ncbi:hypothetical protein [Halomarina oriensis]|uniref:Uncharacterized protein n=1 Tax=Halomarina oriensis TaxID=671145 RepID=A0A6B0GTE9_9EURY|nr:hypothetical protein [Halomarina oriensis]MWG35893.1 hypothetical protein [Halomarina oriensis]